MKNIIITIALLTAFSASATNTASKNKSDDIMNYQIEQIAYKAEAKLVQEIKKNSKLLAQKQNYNYQVGYETYEIKGYSTTTTWNTPKKVERKNQTFLAMK